MERASAVAPYRVISHFAIVGGSSPRDILFRAEARLRIGGQSDSQQQVSRNGHKDVEVLHFHQCFRLVHLLSCCLLLVKDLRKRLEMPHSFD